MITVEDLSFELPTDTEWMVIPENSPTAYEVWVRYYNFDDSEKYRHKETAEVFLIFVWKWWSLSWYKNKYDLAAMFAGKRDMSTFIIENPWISRDNPELYFDSAMDFIYKKIREKKWIEKIEIRATWFSAWAHFLGRFAYKYPDIKRVNLINPVLRNDLDEFINWLNNFNPEDRTNWILISQWENDPDYPLHDKIEKLKHYIIYRSISWADHQLTNLSLDDIIWYICDPFNWWPDESTVYRTCPHCWRVFDKYIWPCECLFCWKETLDKDKVICQFCWKPTKYIESLWDHVSWICENCWCDMELRKEWLPRKDVEESMKKYSEKIEESDKKCPTCWKKMKEIYFKSPAWTWQKMCWRAWSMTVCPDCKQEYNFCCHVMN